MKEVKSNKFDLEKALSGHKVITKKGYEVQIWKDFSNEQSVSIMHSVFGAYKYRNGRWILACWDANGNHCNDTDTITMHMGTISIHKEEIKNIQNYYQRNDDLCLIMAPTKKTYYMIVHRNPAPACDCPFHSTTAFLTTNAFSSEIDAKNYAEKFIEKENYISTISFELED